MHETVLSTPQLDPQGVTAGPGIGTSIVRLIFFRIVPRIINTVWVRPRNLIFSMALQTSGFRVGSHPRILNIRRMRIGPHFTALDGLWLETIEQGERYHPTLTIGEHVVCSRFVHIAATHRVTIGDHVLIGSHVMITDHNHGLYKGEEQSHPDLPPRERDLTCDGIVTVESNVWIGDGVTVLPGSHIGKGSIIGANSTVNSAIPPYCIAVGNPAKPIRCYKPEVRRWEPITPTPSLSRNNSE